MNLGYYEMMDRVSIIQHNLEDFIRNHKEADERVVELVDKAQDLLGDISKYSASRFYDSFEDE